MSDASAPGLQWWTQPESGRRMAYRLWRLEGARRLVVIVHGFGEHGGRYGAFAQRLADQGFAVVVPDLWGHGESEGLRGDLNVTDCVDSMREATETAWMREAGQASYGVFGHSFGGLVGIQWGLQAPPAMRRLVLQSPLLEVRFHIPPWKYALARFLADAWPTFVISTGLDPKTLTRDSAVVRAYRSDPLVHRMMSAQTYPSMMGARDMARAHAEEMRVPTLLLVGLADAIVSVDAAQAWFARVRCEKRTVSFPDCFHELHHESVRDEVVGLVAAWMTADGA